MDAQVIPIFHSPNYNNEATTFFDLQAPKKKRFFELKKDGTGCVCEGFEIIPHVHGTHIENASHVYDMKVNMPTWLCLPLSTMVVDSVDEFIGTNTEVQFLILRIKNDGNGNDSSNIPNILASFPSVVLLGTQEPSFDPINDGGLLAFHRAYFKAKPNNFLVELLNLEDARIKCNIQYTCLLNPYFIGDTDAIPCNPVLLLEPGPLSIPQPTSMALSDNCLFCKIIRGVIPSFKVYETSHTFAFMDINPLSEGHIVSLEGKFEYSLTSFSW